MLVPGSCDEGIKCYSQTQWARFLTHAVFLLSQQNLSNRTSWSPVDLLEAFCWALHRKDLNHLFVMAFASKNSCGDTLSESSVDHWALQSKMRGLGRQLGSFYILGFCLLKLGKTRICWKTAACSLKAFWGKTGSSSSWLFIYDLSRSGIFKMLFLEYRYVTIL